MLSLPHRRSDSDCPSAFVKSRWSIICSMAFPSARTTSARPTWSKLDPNSNPPKDARQPGRQRRRDRRLPKSPPRPRTDVRSRLPLLTPSLLARRPCRGGKPSRWAMERQVGDRSRSREGACGDGIRIWQVEEGARALGLLTGPQGRCYSAKRRRKCTRRRSVGRRGSLGRKIGF
jgi:hypothetical protein